MTRCSNSPFFLLSLFLFKIQRSSKMIRSSTSPFVLFVAVVVKVPTQQLLSYDITMVYVTMISGVEKHVHIYIYIQVLAYMI